MHLTELFSLDRRAGPAHPRGSQVIYLTAGLAAQQAQRLIDQGLHPATPVALVVEAAAPNPSDTDLAGYGSAWFG